MGQRVRRQSPTRERRARTGPGRTRQVAARVESVPRRQHRRNRPLMPRVVNPAAVDSASWWRGTEAMENSQPGPAVTGVVVTTTHILCLAVAAYLARFKGQSRIHTESDLRGYLSWCEARGLDPLAATDLTSSSTSAGCKRCAATGPRRCHAACRWSPASTAPASSTPCSSTRRPSTCGARTYPPNRPHWD